MNTDKIKAIIVDIAIIDTSGAELMNTLVRPMSPILERATAIHGVRNEDVTDAPTFADIQLNIGRLIIEAMAATPLPGENEQGELEGARKILGALEEVPLPPRRPATKIEIEAIQSICNMQDELEEARKIIRALLGAPSPRIWKKWPNIHKQATDFLKQHKLELQEE